jgi:hypothetical protein
MAPKPSPGRKPLRLLLIALTLLMVAAGLLLSLSRKLPDEPVYEGKPLGYWTARLYNSTNRAASLKALRSIAPSAADYFFEVVRRTPDDTLLRSGYRSWYLRRSPNIQHHLPVPPLDHTAELRRVAGYLQAIANEASTSILKACSDPDRDVRFVAVQVVPYIRPVAEEAVTCLGPLLVDPDAAVRGEAAVGLLRLRTDNKLRALPWIEQALKQSDDATPPAFLTILCGLLEEIGPASADLAPMVSPLMNSDSVTLRTQAALTLWKISGNSDGVSYLIDRLKQTPPLDVAFRHLLSRLAAMGPAAAPAVPVLEDKLSQITNAAPSPTSESLARDIQTILQQLRKLPASQGTEAPEPPR